MKVVYTGKSNPSRPFWRRVEWGVKMGAAEVFDGAVSLLSFGQMVSNLGLEVCFRLALKESRRYREENPDA